MIYEDLEKKLREKEAELDETKAQKEDLERWKDKFMRNNKLDEALKQLENCFDGFIRLWSLASNVVQWEDAQVRLLRITWSTSLPPHLAKNVWEMAVRMEDK